MFAWTICVGFGRNDCGAHVPLVRTIRTILGFGFGFRSHLFLFTFCSATGTVLVSWVSLAYTSYFITSDFCQAL